MKNPAGAGCQVLLLKEGLDLVAGHFVFVVPAEPEDNRAQKGVHDLMETGFDAIFQLDEECDERVEGCDDFLGHFESPRVRIEALLPRISYTKEGVEN